MLEVKIDKFTDSEERNEKWHDLMTSAGVQDAYDHLDEIFADDLDADYIISDVNSDWAKFDNNTALEDMLDTINVLKRLTDDEVVLFKKLYAEGTHEPIDIAKAIRFNEMKYIEDTDDEDEIWETVYSDKEQRVIAIFH